LGNKAQSFPLSILPCLCKGCGIISGNQIDIDHGATTDILKGGHGYERIPNHDSPGALTALLVWLGDMFGGRQGAVMALIFGGMNFFSYWFSDKIVLKCTALRRSRRTTTRSYMV
jgi:hypothetical protein